MQSTGEKWEGDSRGEKKVDEARCLKRLVAPYHYFPDLPFMLLQTSMDDQESTPCSLMIFPSILIWLSVDTSSHPQSVSTSLIFGTISLTICRDLILYGSSPSSIRYSAAIQNN